MTPPEQHTCPGVWGQTAPSLFDTATISKTAAFCITTTCWCRCEDYFKKVLQRRLCLNGSRSECCNHDHHCERKLFHDLLLFGCGHDLRGGRGQCYAISKLEQRLRWCRVATCFFRPHGGGFFNSGMRYIKPVITCSPFVISYPDRSQVV